MKLTRDEIDSGFAAIQHHGFSSLFPNPPEWYDVCQHYDDIATWIGNQDLHQYNPQVPLRVFAPKNRFGVRAVTHLHPVDLIIYTSLVLILRQDIESNRSPLSKKRVFAFRKRSATATLYDSLDTYQSYRDRMRERARLKTKKFVAITDIADFYPRLYQHRLENALTAAATSPRNEMAAKVLVAKLLPRLSNGVSYGIPIGPFASRPLAEALMIDTDIYLENKGLDFVRWVDDFTFFCKTDSEAQHCIFTLAKWLWDEHGLTLQGAKTRVVSTEHFLSEIVLDPEDRLQLESDFLRDIWTKTSPYLEDDEEEAADLTEEELDQLEATSFRELLEVAMQDISAIEYDIVAFVLGRIVQLKEFTDEMRNDIVDVILDNVEHLYPVSDSVAKFFLSFGNLKTTEKKRIGAKLLKPIIKSNPPPPDYYVMWVLSVFSSDASWNNSDNICKLFQETQSETVMRYAALALEKNGQRSHALQVRDKFDAASPLLKLAILRASRNLGPDERKFWIRGKQITFPLEKKI